MIAKNNPFNIRHKPSNIWKGQVGEYKGFCVFDSLLSGIRAAAYLLMVSYPKRRKFTYAELLECLYPLSESPTDRVILFVCDRCSCYPFDVPCNILDYALVLRALWQFEQGNLINCPTTSVFCDYLKSFNFKKF